MSWHWASVPYEEDATLQVLSGKPPPPAPPPIKSCFFSELTLQVLSGGPVGSKSLLSLCCSPPMSSLDNVSNLDHAGGERHSDQVTSGDAWEQYLVTGFVGDVLLGHLAHIPVQTRLYFRRRHDTFSKRNSILLISKVQIPPHKLKIRMLRRKEMIGERAHLSKATRTSTKDLRKDGRLRSDIVSFRLLPITSMWINQIIVRTENPKIYLVQTHIKTFTEMVLK